MSSSTDCFCVPDYNGKFYRFGYTEGCGHEFGPDTKFQESPDECPRCTMCLGYKVPPSRTESGIFTRNFSKDYYFRTEYPVSKTEFTCYDLVPVLYLNSDGRKAHLDLLDEIPLEFRCLCRHIDDEIQIIVFDEDKEVQIDCEKGCGIHARGYVKDCVAAEREFLCKACLIKETDRFMSDV